MSVFPTLEMYRKISLRVLTLVTLFSVVALVLIIEFGKDDNHRKMSLDKTVEKEFSTNEHLASGLQEKSPAMADDITATKIKFPETDTILSGWNSNQFGKDVLWHKITSVTSAQPSQKPASLKRSHKLATSQNSGDTSIARIDDSGHTQDVLSQTTGATKHPGDMKFLLSLSFLQGGPNFSYQNFKMGLFYAILHNRAIVTLPFANHYGHRDEPFFWAFDDTFDRNVLKQVIPVITPEQYREECNGTVDFMLMDPYTKRNNRTFSAYEHAYKVTRGMLASQTNITIPPWEDRPMSVRESRRRYMAGNKVRCLAMYKPLDFWRPMNRKVSVHRKTDVVNTVAGHLVRALSLKQRADAILENLFRGKPFLSMHWRNRTGEICQMLLRNEGKLDCNGLLAYIHSASQKVVQGVEQIMYANELPGIYIAYPSYSSAIIQHMKARIPNVYTSRDILALDIPEVAGLNANYLLSLVEQEIVYRGSVFIASLTSNWSKFVAEERAANNKPTIFLNEVPGVPNKLHKLI